MRERVDEAVEIIKCVPILTKQIDSLEVCEHFLSLWVIIKFEIIKFVNTFYVFMSYKFSLSLMQAQVKRLTLLLDKLTGDVYNLTVQAAALEKACFD